MAQRFCGSKHSLKSHTQWITHGSEILCRYTYTAQQKFSTDK